MLIKCRQLKPNDPARAGHQPAFDFDLPSPEISGRQDGRGEVVSFIGPDPEYRSIWLKTLCGLEEQATGTLEIEDKDSLQLSGDELAIMRTRIAYLHSDTALMSSANGLANILAPALYHHVDDDIGKQALTDKAIELIGQLDADIDLSTLPAYLNRGQCFKLALARALLLQPPLLVLDNPFAHFERAERNQVQHFLCRKVDEGLSILITTRDMRYILSHSDRIIFFDEHMIHPFSSAAELRHCQIDEVKTYMKQYPET